MKEKVTVMYSNLILASWLIWGVLSVYQVYQHCKGNCKFYRVSNRYINFIILLIIMLVTWFILMNMQIDELMEVRHVKY